MSQTYESLITDLMGRWPESRIEPSLVRIASVVELLGDPQRAYPVIHVTGTNGKTSTARMIESLLRSMGLRTGLYTSPHLIDPRERIIFDGEPISVERFTRTWDDIAPYVELVDKKSVADGGIPLSFFEVMTAIAFAAFADAPVDVAIIEVGMGGTWDATNVADGMVNVVTPIGLDHHEYLGDSLIEIASEKAGIITEGSVAILAAQDVEAAEILIERCAEVDAVIARQGVEFGVIQRDVAVGGQLLSLQGLHGRYDDVFLPLFGEHQAHNAAVALAATEAFIGNSELDPEIVREGFATVTSPGRLEILRRNPTIIVDAAHNPHGARALAGAVDDSFEFSRLIGVIGMLEEKDATGILTALEPVLDQVVITSPRSPRALGAEDLADLAIEIFGEERVRCEVSLSSAIDTAITVAEEESMYGGVGVLITGSVVLVGDAKRILGEAR
ncbi:MAG: bifunctional folylpolyglutamate synthase/dihydrofolate synthase [Actinomycetes bacterium]